MKSPFAWCGAACLTVLVVGTRLTSADETCRLATRVFPGREWEARYPESVGVDSAKLDQIAQMLAGSGWIVRDGYVIKRWGSPQQRRDWFSSAKPIFSTLLFFAIQEGRVLSVDEKIEGWGWKLRGKDREITFRHLADMTSNYLQPHGPGETFDYNDYAINLYVRTLEKVFEGAISDAAGERLYAPLEMQDAPHHQDSPQKGQYVGRAWLSPRDFGRLCWFWMSQGEWNGKRLLAPLYFSQYMKPDVRADLPYSDTVTRDNLSSRDYLSVGTFGGGVNQHRDYGSGIYGFNWWFNRSGTFGPTHRRRGQLFDRTWPGVPADTVMTSGYGGNHSVMIPSQRILLVSGGGAWKGATMEPDDPEYFNNRVVKLLADSVQSAHRD